MVGNEQINTSILNRVELQYFLISLEVYRVYQDKTFSIHLNLAVRKEIRVCMRKFVKPELWQSGGEGSGEGVRDRIVLGGRGGGGRGGGGGVVVGWWGGRGCCDLTNKIYVPHNNHNITYFSSASQVIGNNVCKSTNLYVPLPPSS